MSIRKRCFDFVKGSVCENGVFDKSWQRRGKWGWSLETVVECGMEDKMNVRRRGQTKFVCHCSYVIDSLVGGP